MDLLSSIRKEGSRGGVDFKWEDVTTSQHRENYLGHSLMAPVGRWQKNKDLSWYAKGDSSSTITDAAGNVVVESAEEKRIRERKEEIKRIKEAEEDALARALGLPVVERGNGPGSGANAIDVKEMGKVIRETEEGDDEIEEVGRGGRFGNFVGKAGGEDVKRAEGEGIDNEAGGLVSGRKIDGPSKISKRRQDGKDEKRNHSRERRHRHHHRHRERSRERDEDRRHHRDEEDRPRERRRTRSPSRKERRPRSRSDDRNRRRREDRDVERERRRDPASRHRDRRSRSPDMRDRDRKGDKEGGSHRRRD